jgi:hypothetical protein
MAIVYGLTPVVAVGIADAKEYGRDGCALSAAFDVLSISRR